MVINHPEEAISASMNNVGGFAAMGVFIEHSPSRQNWKHALAYYPGVLLFVVAISTAGWSPATPVQVPEQPGVRAPIGTAAADAPRSLAGPTGNSENSGHPLMKAEAIVRAALDFSNCLARLWPQAEQANVTQDTFERAIASLTPDLQLLETLDNQPEFNTPIGRYLDHLVTQARIDRGRDLLARFQKTFDEISRRFGVDRFVVAAIWGIETNYGAERGHWSVLRSTATLACIGRRQHYFQREFIAALNIMQEEDITAERLTGSWSGAFGQVQMMPTEFRTFAIDFDGDGRRDIIDSVPDALASTAQYLKLHGWESERSWGHEVRLADGFDPQKFGRSRTMVLSEWASHGVRAATDNLPQDDWPASLLLPAGVQGPAFLVSNNYRVILRYNPAGAYALAVLLLSDRLRGAAPLEHAWPQNNTRAH